MNAMKKWRWRVALAAIQLLVIIGLLVLMLLSTPGIGAIEFVIVGGFVLFAIVLTARALKASRPITKQEFIKKFENAER